MKNQLTTAFCCFLTLFTCTSMAPAFADETVGNKLDRAVDKMNDKARDLKDRAKDRAKELHDSAKDKAQKGLDKV